MASQAARISSDESWPVSASRRHRVLVTAAVVSGVVLATTFLGIATRSSGLLAALWPANACLLGLLVRWPRFASPVGWAAAVGAYLIADLATGSSVLNTLLLTSANLAGVIVGYVLFMRLDQAHRRLQHPKSVVCFILIVAASSLAASVFGLVANPVVLGGGALIGLSFWFAAELVNYIAFLPVILSMPVIRWPRPDRRSDDAPVAFASLVRAAPAIALALSFLLAIVVGGPGALAFPVTALLWCALAYSVFTTAVLGLTFTIWALSAIKLGVLAAWLDTTNQHALISIRLGVTLMTLAPLTVAIVVAARNELLARLSYIADHDSLTGVLNRRAFMERTETARVHSARAAQSVAALMMDIDHFKRINDAYGHAAGDQVLKAFAVAAGRCLRATDLLGRLGGEEFAVLLVGCGPGEAAAVAERIRGAIAGMTVDANGVGIASTVSIGMVEAPAIARDVESLLKDADAALYAAKAGGRNRVEIADAVANN